MNNRDIINLKNLTAQSGSRFQSSYGKILKISIEEMYNQGLEFYFFEIKRVSEFSVDFLEEQLYNAKISSTVESKLTLLINILKEYSASLGFERIPYAEFSYYVIDRTESNISLKGIVGIRPIISGIGEEILMSLKNVSFTHYDSNEQPFEHPGLLMEFGYLKELENVKKYLNSIFYIYKDFKYHFLNVFEPRKGVSYMSRSILNELVTFLYRRNNDNILERDLGPGEDPEIAVNIKFFEATYLYSSSNDWDKPKYYWYKNYHDKDWYYDRENRTHYSQLMLYPMVLNFRQRKKGIYNIIEIFQIYLLLENLKYKSEDRSLYREDKKVYSLEYVVNNFSMIYERLLNEASIYFQLEHCDLQKIFYEYWVEGKKLLLENPEICFLESKQRFSNMQDVTYYNNNIYLTFQYVDLIGVHAGPVRPPEVEKASRKATSAKTLEAIDAMEAREKRKEEAELRGECFDFIKKGIS